MRQVLSRNVDPRTLSVHPLLKLVPRMRPKEWKDFLKSVEERREILEPITATEEGEILDGKHRWEAAKLKGLRMDAWVLSGLTDLEQLNLVVKKAVMPRHLTADQRAMLAVRMEKEFVKLSHCAGSRHGWETRKGKSGRISSARRFAGIRRACARSWPAASGGKRRSRASR